MSKLARAVALVAMLVAMNLAGMTTIAHAQVNQDRIDRHRALGRLELFVAGDHDPRRPPLERQVTSMSRRQPSGAADATLRRLLARERFSVPDGAPAQAQPTSPVRPAAPGGQAGWLTPALAALAAALALVAGVAVLAARRTTRTHRGQSTA
jgi:hypothetical protein